MSALILATPEERVKLLRAGLTGKQIETVFVVLNGFSTATGRVLFDPHAQAITPKMRIPSGNPRVYW